MIATNWASDAFAEFWDSDWHGVVLEYTRSWACLGEAQTSHSPRVLRTARDTLVKHVTEPVSESPPAMCNRVSDNGSFDGTAASNLCY